MKTNVNVKVDFQNEEAWNSFVWKAKAQQPNPTLNLRGENSTLTYLTTKIVIQRSSRDAKYSVSWWQIMVMLIAQ